MRRPPPAFALLLFVAAVLSAGPALMADPSRTPDSVPDLASIVGMGLQEAAERFGTPEAVFVLRGAEPWQDDVVFRFASGLYLYWYQNRVWQARLDVHYGGEILQLRMGAERQRVRELLGQPWREEEDVLVYLLEDRGYPVRLRFYFERDLLVDVYCYRGDL